MKIVFRLNYHTGPGQSLWLKYAILLGDSGVRFDQMAPLHWINEQQWETTVDINGAGRLRMEYSYQLRQAGNGVELDEWLAPLEGVTWRAIRRFEPSFTPHAARWTFASGSRYFPPSTMSATMLVT